MTAANQHFTFSQLEQLWVSNGGSSASAPMAAAVAMAESGGNTGTGPNATDDWGIWQIHGGGPAMLDPNANAKRAVQMSDNGANWRPWCTAWSDNACGSKGGTYEGPGSRYLAFVGGGGGDGFNATPIGSTSAAGEGCLWQLPSLSLGPVNLGGWCVIGRSQGRALLGAVSLVGGALVMAFGAGLILAGTRAGRAIAGVIPYPVAQVAARGASAAETPPRRRPAAPPRPDPEADAAAETGRANRGKAPRSYAGGRSFVGRSVSMDELAAA